MKHEYKYRKSIFSLTQNNGGCKLFIFICKIYDDLYIIVIVFYCVLILYENLYL